MSDQQEAPITKYPSRLYQFPNGGVDNIRGEWNVQFKFAGKTWYFGGSFATKMEASQYMNEIVRPILMCYKKTEEEINAMQIAEARNLFKEAKEKAKEKLKLQEKTRRGTASSTKESVEETWGINKGLGMKDSGNVNTHLSTETTKRTSDGGEALTSEDDHFAQKTSKLPENIGCESDTDTESSSLLEVSWRLIQLG